jgi:hypothetical protein
MVFFQVFMAVKHHLPHLIPVRRESAPKQQQIVLLPGPQKTCGQDKKRLQVVIERESPSFCSLPSIWYA